MRAKKVAGREEEKELEQKLSSLGKMKKVNRVPLVVLVVPASILVITFVAPSPGGFRFCHQSRFREL